MRLQKSVFFCSVLISLASALPAATQALNPGRDLLEEAVGVVKPALVRIHVVTTAYRDGRELKFQSSGSGAIISPEGYVVTNHHVAGHSKRILCTLADKSEVEAELIGTDALTDIAVIKLAARASGPYPSVSFGDSDAVQVGDNVLAMGSPLSLSQSVTAGIVSNTEMVMPKRMGFGNFELDGEDVGTLVKWIAHDAVIYPGNSGGPLVNLRGEIVGINEISLGLGGAIPGNLAKQSAQDLIKSGEVQRSWLGLTAQPLLKHAGSVRGVLIAGTIEGSPADKAGLKSGDIMVRLSGVETFVRYDEELPEFNRLIANLPLGKEVESVVLRDGKEMKLSMTTTLRQPREPKEREFKEWGLTGQNLSFVIAKELKRDTTDGVAVTSVAAGGPAGDAKPGIRRGDILVRVGDTAITNIEDLVRVTEGLLKGAKIPVPVLATFDRKAGSFVTAVKVGVRELNDPGLEVKKAWLPVNTQVITRDLAELMGNPAMTGFRVVQVFKGSSAEKAGVQVGDLILAVDGQKLTASAPEHYEELPTLIRNYSVGATVELAVLRDGKDLKVPVELIRAPMLDREMRKYRNENFEFTARDITMFDKADEQWEEAQHGVLVTELQPGSWAELGMMRVGDLIQEVEATSINSVEELQAAMEDVEQRRAETVAVKVLRGIYTLFIELEPKWDKN
jgi:serine protease Do